MCNVPPLPPLSLTTHNPLLSQTLVRTRTHQRAQPHPGNRRLPAGVDVDNVLRQQVVEQEPVQRAVAPCEVVHEPPDVQSARAGLA